MADMFVTRPNDESNDPEKDNEDDDDDYDDDEGPIDHVALNGTLKDLITSHPNFDFMDFVLYYPPENNSNDDDVKMDEGNDDDGENVNLCGRKYVWTGPDCCCRDESFVPLPPSKSHTYKLDLIVVSTSPDSSSDDNENQQQQTGLERKIQITGPNETSCASTVAGILSWLFSTSSMIVQSVTLQAFATNPRLIFPTILYDDIYNISSPPKKDTMIRKLCLSFVGINDATTVQALTYGFEQLELKQCTTNDDVAFTNNMDMCVYSNILFGSQVSSLVISCANPEFMKFATQWSTSTSIHSTSSGTSSGSSRLLDLHLKLHFWLQGPSMKCFCEALESNNPPIEKLVIEYLDIVDEAWYRLFEAISKTTNLKYVKVCFTDNFVDNYRRLTPERRTSRTQAVLDCLRTQTSLEEIMWPTFQQDETLIPQIQLALQNNNLNKMSLNH